MRRTLHRFDRITPDTRQSRCRGHSTSALMRQELWLLAKDLAGFLGEIGRCIRLLQPRTRPNTKRSRLKFSLAFYDNSAGHQDTVGTGEKREEESLIWVISRVVKKCLSRWVIPGQFIPVERKNRLSSPSDDRIDSGVLFLEIARLPRDRIRASRPEQVSRLHFSANTTEHTRYAALRCW